MANFIRMISRSILLTTGLFLGGLISAQQTDIDPVLESFLVRNEVSGTMVDLFVHGNANGIKEFTEDNGGIFKRSLNSISRSLITYCVFLY